MNSVITPNFDNELQIHRYANGFKLLRSPQKPSDIATLPIISIADLLTTNCSIYFVDTKGIIRNSNQIHAECFGFDTLQSVLGISVFDLTESAIAKNYFDNNSNVMNAKQIKIIEETVLYKRDESLHKCVSIKAPLYNEKEKVVGLLGCSIILNKHPIAEVLAKVTELGLLSHTLAQAKPNTITSNISHQLTARENEILHYYVRGYTTRSIASLLSRSGRTIEQHIMNIKNKVNVQTKSELINLAFDEYKK